MRVDIIPVEKDKNIVFVPESVDYFLADDLTAEVVSRLEEGYENIKDAFPGLTEEEYKELERKVCRIYNSILSGSGFVEILNDYFNLFIITGIGIIGKIIKGIRKVYKKE